MHWSQHLFASCKSSRPTRLVHSQLPGTRDRLLAKRENNAREPSQEFHPRKILVFKRKESGAARTPSGSCSALRTTSYFNPPRFTTFYNPLRWLDTYGLT